MHYVVGGSNKRFSSIIQARKYAVFRFENGQAKDSITTVYKVYSYAALPIGAVHELPDDRLYWFENGKRFRKLNRDGTLKRK